MKCGKAKQQSCKEQIKITSEIFAPIKNSFPRQKIVPKYIDEIWSIDLIDKSKLSKYNEGNHFILTVIDNFSKYAWAMPLKNKSGKSITDAFTQIAALGRIPNKIWGDQGKEFYNKDFKRLLSKHNIEIYSTYSELKAVFVERFNRTLQDKLKGPMFMKNDSNWINLLDDIIHTYNNTIHSTIKMKPIEASKKENSNKVLWQVVDKRKFKPENKLNIGDFVRLRDKKHIFSKGYQTNWGYELFTVAHVSVSQPTTYLIKDGNGEDIMGKHYRAELLKSSFNYENNKSILNSLNINF
jgi:hypothetical protein